MLATFVVAASNSSLAWKSAADYVATGVSDQDILNEALAALSPGGQVLLAPGIFNISGHISWESMSGVSLMGVSGGGPIDGGTIHLLGRDDLTEGSVLRFSTNCEVLSGPYGAVENIVFDYSPVSGWNANFCVVTAAYRTRLVNCIVYKGRVIAGSGGGCYIANNHIEWLPLSTSASVIVFGPNTRVVGNVILPSDDLNFAGDATGIQVSTATDVVVSGNRLGVNGEGIRVQTSTSRVNVVNNVIRKRSLIAGAIGIHVGSGALETNVTGNFVDMTGRTAVQIDAGAQRTLVVGNSLLGTPPVTNNGTASEITTGYNRLKTA